MRNLAWPVVLAVALLLSPGCLSGGKGQKDPDGPVSLSASEIEARLSQPIFKQLEYAEAAIEGSNGTKLWLDVYRPGDSPDPVPVILVVTPYRVLSDAQNTQCTDLPRQRCPYLPDLVSFYVPRGYAVAFADSPGNHNSGGCFDFAGPETGQAGYRTVEWLANQSWSNGRVGMYGGSYDAQAQLATAVLNPPHLVTILPTAAPPSGYDFLNYDGVPYFFHDSSMPSYLAVSAAPGQDPGSVETYPGRFECQPENLQRGSDTSGDWNEYWEARNLRPLAPRIQASVLAAQGFLDTTVRPDVVDGFWNILTSEKRFVIGQWDHEQPTRKDWSLIVHRWLDHYLKGIDTGLLHDLPPVLTQDMEGNWTGIDSFPPLQANVSTFFLSADGALSTTPTDNDTLPIQDYPRGSLSEVALQLAPSPATLGGAAIPDKLIFTSEPLKEDLRIVGRPVVHLVASTNAKSTHWAAQIFDADKSPRLAGSDSGQLLNFGFADTRHRHGLDKPADLAPGESYDVSLRLYPSNDIIPKGHRIRLELNNNHPTVMQDTTFATSTIQFGGADGTRLVLPLAPIGVQLPGDALRLETT